MIKTPTFGGMVFIIAPVQFQGFVIAMAHCICRLMVIQHLTNILHAGFPIKFSLVCTFSLGNVLLIKIFFLFSTWPSVPVLPYCWPCRTALSPRSFTMSSASSLLRKFLLNPSRKKAQNQLSLMHIWRLFTLNKKTNMKDCIVKMHFRIRVSQQMQWRSFFCNNVS